MPKLIPVMQSNNIEYFIEHSGFDEAIKINGGVYITRPLKAGVKNCLLALTIDEKKDGSYETKSLSDDIYITSLIVETPDSLLRAELSDKLKLSSTSGSNIDLHLDQRVDVCKIAGRHQGIMTARVTVDVSKEFGYCIVVVSDFTFADGVRAGPLGYSVIGYEIEANIA